MQAQRRTPRTAIALAVIALAALAAGCSSAPKNNAALDQARQDYSVAQGDVMAREGAPAEMKQAADALARAEDAFKRSDDSVDVDHYAYLARARTAIARETGAAKGAEKAMAEATVQRDQVRLQARTAEADAAQRSAASAQQDAAAAQRQAATAQQQANASQQRADASQGRAEASQQATAAAEARNRALQAQISELNAKPTDRGLVITLGDVLFDTAEASLKPGGARSVEKLVAFMNQYPERKALVEGFTDSVGSEDMNQGLSARRADAVRAALVGQGIGADRIAVRGYGEAFPVAGNDNASGRQLNRRVEIVLSGENGMIAPR